MRAYDILGLGSPVVDRLIHVEEAFLEAVPGIKGGADEVDLPTLEAIIKKSCAPETLVPGGAVANTIKGLASLGHTCALLGMVGDDHIKAAYLEKLDMLGILPIFLQGDGPSGQVLCLITPDGERTQRPFPGASLQMQGSHLEPLHLRPAKWLILEGFAFRNPGLLEQAVELALKEKVKIALGTSSFEIIREFRKPLEALLAKRALDVLFTNEDEAKEITGLAASDAVSELARFSKIAIVTLGDEGCLVQRGSEKLHCESKSLTPKDTTGAGDLFAAGFLHGLIHDYSLHACAQLGCLLGGEVTQHVGPEIPAERWPSLVGSDHLFV